MLSGADKNGYTSKVVAVDNGSNLKLTFKTIGPDSIEDVEGSARGMFLFEEVGRMNEDTGLMLQIGANSNQGMGLERHNMNTTAMKINSICISGFKYAQKAITRLDYALNYISGARATYGAKENRLWHVISGNDNTAENTQASESRLRDTDMAKEMVSYSRANILMQASQAILAQSSKQKAQITELLG